MEAIRKPKVYEEVSEEEEMPEEIQPQEIEKQPSQLGKDIEEELDALE